jgi:NAD-dependent deacetylase
MEGASLDTVKAWVQQAHHIAVLTGAGISAESGVSTFRDAQTGYWAQFRPEDMATEAGFRAHPQRVWDWYQYRRDLLTGVAPNAVHQALAAFAQHTRIGSRSSPRAWTVCTSARAASACCACMGASLYTADWICRATAATSNHAVAGQPPYCDRCGNLLRPGVVWLAKPCLFHSGVSTARSPHMRSDAGRRHGRGGVPGGRSCTPGPRCGGPGVVVNPAPSKLDSAAHGGLRGTTASVLPELLVTG